MGDVGQWFGGGTPSKANPRFWTGGDIPWVSPKDMKSDLITDTQDHITEDAVEQSATNLVEAGSVLIVVRSGILQHTLPVALAQRQVALNQDLKAVKPLGNIRSDYLAFALKTFEREILQSCTKTGTTVQSLALPVFLRFPFPVAPLAEQGRIVAKLDTMLSRVAAGEAAARRALDRLQRYRAAVLHAAVTGELTRDWRKTHKSKQTGEQLLKRLLAERRTRWEEAELERLLAAGKPPKDDKWKKRYQEPTEPKRKGQFEMANEWLWASVAQTGQVETGSTPSKSRPDFFGGEVPFFKPTDLDAGYHVVSSADSLTAKGAEHARLLPERSILVTCIGATIGKTGFSRKPGATNQQINALIPTDAGMGEFLYFVFVSPRTQDAIRASASATTLPILNKSKFERLPLPLPPAAEQAEIVREVERRLTAAERLAATLQHQLERSQATRQSLLREAFAGNLVPQDPNDEPASVLLDRIRDAREAAAEALKNQPKTRRGAQRQKENVAMKQILPSPETLRAAWQTIGKKPDAQRLFQAAGYLPDQVVEFYELLRATPEVRESFEAISKGESRALKTVQATSTADKQSDAHFRLVTLWLENFKNLKNYEVRFNPGHGLDVVLGWNGTGKSNLFEAFVLIFRDLHYWWEKNQWPDKPLKAFRIAYEIDEHLVEVSWNPVNMKRPGVRRAALVKKKGTNIAFETVKREELPLPRFVFGYYSGPTNRLAEHFLPMKRDHYDRLRKASSDDPETLARLLEQRRFFCAETHHAKYVLLAFAYKEDRKITQFLEHRLRIVGFESALFVIRRPQWGVKGTQKNFWNATGIMLRVMEKLRRFAIAPMVVNQTVSDGYRTKHEDHYYFYLPDLKSLHEFADEYADARSFFLALESTDFSELIHDVKIQVRVKVANEQEIPITFRELSEGEQQLLMVLGLMRFTKSHQSLVLLDEPDTHLNPHWSVEYLKDLVSVTSDDDKPSPEQQTSQTLMATHDPLVIASLLKDQVHLLKRNRDSLHCYWQQASENPRGLGYTGILLSDMFGFSSDLDDETLGLLTRQVQLAGKPNGLSPAEKNELELLNKQIEKLGFKTVSSDPYYRAFIEALTRRQEALALIKKPEQTTDERAKISKAADEILAELAKKHSIKA